MRSPFRASFALLTAWFTIVGLMAGTSVGCGTADGSDETVVVLDEESEDREPDAEGSSSEAPVRTLSCPEILQCLGDCPPESEDCPSDCGDRSTHEGLRLLNAWWQCVQQHGCDTMSGADAEECVANHCGAETQACLADESSPEPPTSTETGSMGAVPTEVIGTWSSSSTIADTYNPHTGTFSGEISGEGLAHHFAADGSWWSVQIVRTHYACTSTAKIYEEGSVGVDGDVLITKRTGGRSVVDTCGKVRSKRLDQVEIVRYRWSLGRSGGRRVLFLEEIGGERRHRLFYDGS